MSETHTIHPEALELARLLEPSWPGLSERLHVSGVPLNEGTPGAPAAAAPEAGGEPAGGGGEPGGEPQSPSVDYDRIEQMLEGRFSEMEQRLPQQAQPEQQEPDDPYAALAEAYDDPGEAQAAQQLLSQIIGGALEQRLGPLQQELAAERAARLELQNSLDHGDIEERYPALQQQETAQQATQQALEFAQSVGLQVTDARQLPAQFIEMAYLAGLGRQHIASETPAGGGNPGLEAAAGATPPAEQPDIAQNIVNARGGAPSPQSNFWGWRG